MPGDAVDAADHQRITLRIPPGLHRRLIAEAERNGRSLNAEVIARLEASSADGAVPGAADVDSRATAELRDLRRALRAVKYAALDHAAGGFGDPGRAMNRVREAVGLLDVDEATAKAALEGRRPDIWDEAKRGDS